MSAQYVDLGLPSGTKWKNANESGIYSHEEAISLFGRMLPTEQQWEELGNECSWNWNGYGYVVTGSNGNSIFLPAAGIRNYRNQIYGVGQEGGYWLYCETRAISIYLNAQKIAFSHHCDLDGNSVRLVR